MFDFLDIYQQDHFFIDVEKGREGFKPNLPDAPGVFYIFKLANDAVEFVLVGRSYSEIKDGELTHSSLKNAFDEDVLNLLFAASEEENIQSYDIYWFVTLDNKNQDLPGYVEALIMQRIFEIYGDLPPWMLSY